MVTTDKTDRKYSLTWHTDTHSGVKPFDCVITEQHIKEV